MLTEKEILEKLEDAFSIVSKFKGLSAEELMEELQTTFYRLLGTRKKADIIREIDDHGNVSIAVGARLPEPIEIDGVKLEFDEFVVGRGPVADYRDNRYDFLLLTEEEIQRVLNVLENYFELKLVLGLKVPSIQLRKVWLYDIKDTAEGGEAWEKFKQAFYKSLRITYRNAVGRYRLLKIK